jgi:hypothetical protein
VTEVFGADRNQPQRTGWSTLDAHGNRLFFSDRPASSAEVACPAGVPEPQLPAAMVPAAMVPVDLDPAEREMLVCGLNDWGGPAYGSDALAVAMGFESIDHLGAEAPALIRAIQQGRSLSVLDWTRALVATEFAFISVVLGTGVDEWSTVNGGSGEKWIGVLRRLQGKLPMDSAALSALASSPGDPRSPAREGAVAEAEPDDTRGHR